MSFNDPVSDMFTRIRNALSVGHSELSLPFSNLKLSIAKILKEEGFIEEYGLLNEDRVKKLICIKLKYTSFGKPVISYIRRVSKCGKRIYTPKKNVPKVRDGFGISILSTSKGVLSGRKARQENVGGELLAVVY